VASKREDSSGQRSALYKAIVEEVSDVYNTTDNLAATQPAISPLSILSASTTLSHLCGEDTLGRLLARFNTTPMAKLEDLTDVCIRILDMESDCTISRATTDYFCGAAEGTSSEREGGH
jgi:hypothetical protein